MRRPTVVITRPQPEADEWVDALRARGWPALALPLLRLDVPQSADRQAALRDLWSDLSACDALMFVSAAAVRFFFGLRPEGWRRPARWPRCWAPGPATAQVLRSALAQIGGDMALVDSPAPNADQFDSEALWQTVASQVQPGFRLCLVRGDSDAGDPLLSDAGLPGVGREWLSHACQAQGAQVRAVVAYERRLSTWTAPADACLLQTALSAPIWLLSNREALQSLAGVSPRHWREKTAIVTHRRIGEAAVALGFRRLCTCGPGVSGLVLALESVNR